MNSKVELPLTLIVSEMTCIVSCAGPFAEALPPMSTVPLGE